MIDVDFKVTAPRMSKALESVVAYVIEDEETRLEIHNLWAKLLNDYVPMDEGFLSQNIEVTPEYIRYPGPYAHYQYIGEVYGPNIPIFENGVLVGFFSPPKKHPTGQDIVYNTEKHPKASKEWDKAAMAEKYGVFVSEAQKIIERRCRELVEG